MPALFTAIQSRPAEERLEEAQVVAQLVRRCAQGDAAAWEELVQRFHRRVYNICYRFAGSADDAQDLTQEVFLKVYRTVASFDGDKASFSTWMTTVTRNLLVDHFRKTRNDRSTDSIDAPLGGEDEGPTLADRLASDGRENPHLSVEARERREMVQGALSQISPDLREAVILRDLQDMDYREIAQVLRVPEGTVKSRINRGRAELARLLQRTYKQAL
ncbi:MAG: sigma-70 family RNA polymerase sigma factor [Acidobacteriota bacterium]|nr:sigma-70 family RNA polymerase sigma factor [Acidobacteriota bacterium]